MPTSKLWQPQEDKALMVLRLARGLTSWTQINQLLIDQFKITNKTPKLCRERFINHLNPQIVREEWTPEEEKALLHLHSLFGSRWAQISRHLPGRTDNSVKNKFFSKYRHALKNLNHILEQNKKYRKKVIKISFVHKLINFIGYRDRRLISNKAESIKNAEYIKNGIISFEQINKNIIENQQTLYHKIQELMFRIQQFTSNSRRNSDKKRIEDKNKAVSTALLSDADLPLQAEEQSSGLLHQKPASISKKQSQSEPIIIIPYIHIQQLTTKLPNTDYLFKGIRLENEDSFWNLQRLEDFQLYLQQEH